MFGGKKKTPVPGVPDVSQMGFIPDISSLGVAGPPQEEDDASLEAELALLMGEEDDGVGRSRGARQPPPPKQKVQLSDINKMAANAMQSIDDDDDDNEDLDDPDLLAELDQLNQPSSPMPSPQPSPRASPRHQQADTSAGPDIQTVLKGRLDNYRCAQTNAEAAGETSKARRFARGTKTLTDLLKKAKMGKQIDESDIPPVVAVGKPGATPDSHLTPSSNQVSTPPSSSVSAPANSVVSPPPVTAMDQSREAPKPAPRQSREESSAQGSATPAGGNSSSDVTLLHDRRNQYKAAALQAKKTGDMITATEYVRIMKQFDIVISTAESGEMVDLSNMPPPPGTAAAPAIPPKQPKVDSPAVQVSAPSNEPPQAPQPTGMSEPKTMLEALQQRATRYKELSEKAKADSNGGKARRMDRAFKQYVDAIKKAKSARPIDFNELPSLPDFPPIPLGGGQGAAKSPAAAAVPTPAQRVPPVGAQQAAPPLPPKAQAAGAGTSVAGPSAPDGATSQKRPSPQHRPAPVQGIDPRKQLRVSANQRQLQTLQERKKKLMAKALKAKKEGDMEEAKRLLKLAKGFDPMIQAAENGLPVNMDSIPDVPGEEPAEEIEMANECVEELSGDPKQLYSRLKDTLSKQIKMCASCEKEYTQLGNVATVKRFREMRDSCQQDLDVLLVAQSHGDSVPRFHYEMRTIPSIRVNADLKETEAEVTIIQGMGYKPPSGMNDEDLDTYVKYEFPYPTDNPQSHKGGWGKGAENPQYNSTSKVHIVRSRTLMSVVKRKAIKCEIYYRKGLLRGDKVFAVANLKLADLENKCEVHESVQLQEGRKPIAGKLELKIRIHHPLSGVKEDHTKEKWLVIDASLPTGAKSKLKTGSGSGSSQTGPPLSSIPDSVEVLKWEISTLKQKMGDLNARGKTVPKEIVAHQNGMQERYKKLILYLEAGGKQAKQAHVQRLETSLPMYLAHAKDAMQAGQKEKAVMFMNKKKLVEKEISSLKR